uniref:Vacuolar protein sorting-associated protein 13A (inferred by orthology to a human protein) n=1 Tax=Strongyloides venezuelensis TaxID=75913 RepID=A0A0K0FDI7_STRVS
MVFESIVADLLNRFLGDFVDNLDASQLNIGIWGGDVKLKDLDVKESALDDLDLPVKLKFGYLSTLVLKIPWKNLYTEPVIADIEGLHLIVVPSKGIVYNSDKTEKNLMETKKKTLERLEDARKEKRKPKDPAADSFSEKMVAQIIKNLQVKIRNIHVRYEDKYTNRQKPFAAGITLEALDFITTDENWKATIHKDVVKIVHKLISMNNLSVYWNSDTRLISDLASKEDIKREMHNGITTQTHRLKDFKFILEPINLEAKLAMNQKPESDGFNWTVPKIDLKASMDQLALAIAKLQYQDILLFLEGQERFNLSAKYVKYRPDLVEYRGHYKVWWKFAYNCILEENIRRKKKNWSWDRMKKHRKLFKDYRLAWIHNQTEANLSPIDKEIIEKAEKDLDVFNLNIARQQAEMEIDRLGLKRTEDQPKGWVSWASSWWGSGSGSTSDSTKPTGNIAKQFEQAMTPEEKAKLFEAIDYQENTPPTNYPKHYVENVVNFNLKELKVMVENALELKFSDLNVNLDQRPSARAIRLSSAIKTVTMTGCGIPMMSVTDEKMNWLTMEVETNPLDGSFDQSVFLQIAPIMLKYHAPAINTAIDVFKPPESVKLNQLTAAAMASYEDVKARSVTGLSHAVDQKSKLKIDIRLHPATIVISETGVFNENKPTLVADLGLLTLQTTDETHGAYDNVKDEKLRKLMIKAYDKFHMRLSNVQIILAENFNKCMENRSGELTKYHVLEPTGLDIKIHKSSIDDLQIAKIKMFGNLPDFKIRISDNRLLMLMGLIFSIPTPPPDPVTESELEMIEASLRPKLKDRAKIKAIMDVQEVETIKDEKVDQTQDDEDSKRQKMLDLQQVQVDINLKLNEVAFILLKGEEEILNASIRRFVCDLKMRTFDIKVQLKLGDIVVMQPQFKSLDGRRSILYLIDNQLDIDEYLITMKFIQANPESPYFEKDYKSTLQAITFDFKSLNLSLNQQALVSLKLFGEQLQKRIENVQAAKDGVKHEVRESTKRKISTSSVQSLSKVIVGQTKSAKKEKRSLKRDKKNDIDETKTIQMSLHANFNSLAVLIGTEKDGLLTDAVIKSVRCNVEMTTKKMKVFAALKEIAMNDYHPKSIHRRLLQVDGDHEMFTMYFTQYNRTEKEKAHMYIDDVDMDVKINFAQMKFIFLNAWVNRMLNWIVPFQAEAQSAAIAAKAKASEKATQAAQNVKQIMEQSPPKIKMDIELGAPTIIVPKISHSYEAIFINFGKLKISNGFFNGVGEERSIIDNMEISLSDTSIFGGELKKDNSNTPFKCEILKPVTFTLNVKRNLCYSWYKEFPEIMIEATMPELDVSMSQGDYVNIMHTLSGNLAEGEILSEEGTSLQSTVEDKNIQLQLNKTAKSEVKEKLTTIAEEEQPKKVLSKMPRLIFSFKIGIIRAGLYRGNSIPGNLNQSAGNNESLTVPRDATRAFAAMSIHGTKLSGLINEDGSMAAEIIIKSFTMNDERKDATKIKRLLDKKVSETASTRDLPFAHINYKKDASNNMIADVITSSFFICLSPEFLALLSSFFVVPPFKEGEDLQKIREQVNATKLTNVPPVTSEVTALSSTQRKSEVPEPVKPTTGSMTVRCDIREMEVILIEKPLDPENSQALILSFNCKLDADHKEDTQYVSGGIRDLQIVSTYYADEKKHLCHYPVLQPLNINLKGSINDLTKDTELNVDVEDVILRISPSIIRLLSAVSQEYTKNQVAQATENKRVTGLVAYPNFWNPKPFDKKNYHWFISEAIECSEYFDDEVKKAKTLIRPIEKLGFTMPKLLVTMESGTEKATQPLIKFESTMNAFAFDWSSLLAVDASLTIQMSYYNESLSIWEPIIEPVVNKDGSIGPWTLRCNIESFQTTSNAAVIDGEAEADADKRRKTPKQRIKIQSKDYLNVTVTKSCILLLYRLSEAFEKAAKQATPPQSREFPGTSPYLIINETGLVIKVANSDSLKVSDNNSDIDVPHSEPIDLEVIGWESSTGLMLEDDDRSADLRLKLLGTEREISVLRAESRVIPLGKTSEGGRLWNMLVDTVAQNNRKIIYLRSLVKFVNHMDVPFEILSQRDNHLDTCGVAARNSEPMIVPIAYLYTVTGEFFLRPVGSDYDVSAESISWYDFKTDNRAWIRCEHASMPNNALFAELVVLPTAVFPEKGDLRSDIAYTVHIFPILTVKNLLPFPITIKDNHTTLLEGGAEKNMNIYEGSTFNVSFDYGGETYESEYTFEHPTEVEKVLYFVGKKNPSLEMYIGLHFGKEHHRQEVSIYAPYWIVNKTGKTISYVDTSTNVTTKICCFTRNKHKDRKRSSSVSQLSQSIEHKPSMNPVILSYPTSDPSMKSKVKFAVEDSNFSNEFPITNAGTTSRIMCTDDNGRKYDVTLEIVLSNNGLTKIVTFSPFFLLYNDSLVDMEVREPEFDEWINVPAESCTGLWPRQTAKRMILNARYAKTNEQSIAFPFTETFESFCRINNDYLGMYVTCSVTESSSVVHIEPYQIGMAPIVLMNATPKPVTFKQKGTQDVYELKPNNMKPFTWCDVLSNERLLEWTNGEYSAYNDLHKNDYRSYMALKERRCFYWVSFLNGRQRILLFTDDLEVAEKAIQKNTNDKMDMELEFTLHGMGISLVNNILGQELIYMSIKHSKTIWEREYKNRYKCFPQGTIDTLEEAHIKWLEKEKPSEDFNYNGEVFNFSKMLCKKKGKEFKVVRHFKPGIYIRISSNNVRKNITFQVFSVQIDNHLEACTFPLVLHVVPPPKSIVKNSEPKPFIDLAIYQQQPESSPIVQYQYFALLLQEFSVQADMGLLAAMLDFVNASAANKKYTKELYQKDIEYTQIKLSDKAVSTAASVQKCLFDDFSFSPLMIHLSFTLNNLSPSVDEDQKQAANSQLEVLNVLLKSVGASITNIANIQDVVLKLASFERKNAFMDFGKLSSEIQSHYMSQALKQFYVLVLGLDIIGNPFGLVRDLSSGVEDLFYQPITGFVQGPEEFAEGIAIGVSSAFSHTIGGVSGAAGRITGTLGKGVAALTMDEDYQRKRQEELNRRPQTFGQGMARGVKGFGAGIIDGITGVATKPIEGAKEGGLGGFAKGVGIGLVGVVTRPISGTVDMASGTFNAIKVCTSGNQFVEAARPMRYIHKDKVVRPYNHYEAKGYKFFRQAEEGSYIETDTFIIHGVLTDKNILIVTDKRLFIVNKHCVTGALNTQWEMLYNDITEPQQVNLSIRIIPKVQKKGFLGLGKVKPKDIEMSREDDVKLVYQKLLKAYNIYNS